MDAPKSTDDRRERQRFGVNAPVTVFVGKSEMPGFTRDLSNFGIYFYLNLAEGVSVGGDFEFMLELPPEITLSTSCTVRCKGHVVRTDNASTKLTGIAAKILEYSIEKEEALSA